MIEDIVKARLFEVVNFVVATYLMGQKRCRKSDACQITSFDTKTLVCGRSFCIIVGSVELGPVPQWEEEGGIADDREGESLPGESL